MKRPDLREVLMARQREAALAALLVVLACAPQHAAGKSRAPLTAPLEDAPFSEPEVAPRGRHSARDITYSQWRKICFKDPEKKPLCRTSIAGSWDTGQMAIRVDVIERQGNARLQILLPVGLYLQSGVKLKVDSSAREIVVPYNWCFSNLCIAAAPASRALIKALEKGGTLSVGVVDTNLVSLSATVPLSQFTSVYRGLPTETIEQVVDE
jgi:invasion protein IalB